ncbi:MAG TPA: globin [Nitriliruptoraceae bacterium]|nr:globin [Nitriliruptoraceae bacterium]
MLEQPNIAAQVGGVAAFRVLVDDFYDRVESDPPLRDLYPDDLEPGKTHLGEFLAQYFGAGNVYSSQHGHPRLRMRHAPFRITHDGAQRWARHMTAAVLAQDWPEDAAEAVLAYVRDATPMMINTVEETGAHELPTMIVGPGEQATS